MWVASGQWRDVPTLFLTVLLVVVAIGPVIAADTPLLGAADFYPSPERPIGWLGDWTGRFRGARDFVLEWDAKTGSNILWKTELPSWGGHSSPIVVGKKVFLTCERDFTVCLDADTGKILWSNEAKGKSPGKGIYHNAYGDTYGTVCSDGQALYVVHYNGVVLSYDFDGNVRWRVDNHAYGRAAFSPILMDGKFIVREGPFNRKSGSLLSGMAAYACKDGAKLWFTDKARVGYWNARGDAPMWVGGEPYVVTSLGQFFNARTGALVAAVEKQHGSCEMSLWLPAVDGDRVVLAYNVDYVKEWRNVLTDEIEVPEPIGMAEALKRDETISFGRSSVPRGKRKGGTWFPKSDFLILTLKAAPDGKGGLKFSVPWRPILVLGGGEVPHVVLSDDIAYFVTDGNHAKPSVSAIELATGRILSPGGSEGWQFETRTLPEYGPCGGLAHFYSHSIMPGDYLTVGDWAGKTRVFSRIGDFRVLAENRTLMLKTSPGQNPMGAKAGGLQSSAFCQGDRIYLRHYDSLYCIGDPKAAEHAAAFAAARAHADAGRAPDALNAYHVLWNAPQLHVRYRAIREIGAVLGAKAVVELSQALRHADPTVRSLAAGTLAGIPDEVVGRLLSAGLRDKNPEYRCLILGILGQRRDRSVAPQVVEAVDDKDGEVRLAALRAVGRLGGAVAVEGVASRFERLTAPDQNAALDALAGMPEPDTEQSLADRLPTASLPARGAILRVLGRRGATGRMELVLADGRHTDRSVRLAAFEALISLASQKELARVVAFMKSAEDGEERKAVEDVLYGVLARSRDAAAYSAVILNGMAGLDKPGYATLVRALGPAGGNESLVAVRKALADKDPAVHAAAIEALAAWPDDAVERDLMSVEASDRNAANLASAVGGILRMVDFSPPNRPVEEIHALYARALETGQALDGTVGHMVRMGDARTIELIVEVITDRREIELAAVNTICEVAPRAAEKDAAKTVEVLEKAGELVVTPLQRERIRALTKDLITQHGSKAIPLPDDIGLDL